MPLRILRAVRYVTPLREGGSVPAIIEGEDDGMYVLKFRGAGQGVKALIAELVAGELGRAIGLSVPELVLVEVEAGLGRNEPDQEIRELLMRSLGCNLAMDYLPRSITFDPAVGPKPSADEASEIVWFDALIQNVDRTARNPNLLLWHRKLRLIDHGAALYFHHDWPSAEGKATASFPIIRDHVLLPFAAGLEAANRKLRPLVTEGLLAEVLAKVPEDWLAAAGEGTRERYVSQLFRRAAHGDAFTEEAIRARALLV